MVLNKRKEVGETMTKGKWVISILIAGNLIGLSGCAEKTNNEKVLEKKVADLQKEIDNSKKAEQKQQVEEQKQIVVNVLDSETKQVIKTIIPKDMGFGSDNAKYKADIEAWAKTLAKGTETTPGYDQRMIPDKIADNSQIIKGTPRRILDEAQLTEKIMQASANGGNVELPITVTQSGYSPDEVPHLGEAVVATYTTKFNSGVAGRTTNIELSAQAINNVIIGTQDIFSFNTTVGPSDQAHGYQPAKEAIDGKLVDGIGGGICQTSSTLYNAVDQLKVAYVEKHHHSVQVGYVPVGRDATVSYGGPDFRFQNTTGVPLLIKTYVDKANGTTTIELRTSSANQGKLNR